MEEDRLRTPSVGIVSRMSSGVLWLLSSFILRTSTLFPATNPPNQPMQSHSELCSSD